MRRLVPLALVVLAAAVTGCKMVPASPEETASSRTTSNGPALGDTVRIQVGDRLSWEGGRFTVVFDSLTADSRCAVDVRCVWAGDAAARLRLVASERRADATLHTTEQPKEAELAGYVVRLVNVEPYPGTFDRSKPTPPAVVVLVVTRG